MSIAIDIAEPTEIVMLIGQVVEVSYLNLNQQNLADYVFTSADGVTIEIEREGIATALNSVPQLEDEIRRHLIPEGRMILMLQGVPVPSPYGCDVYELGKSGVGKGNYMKHLFLCKKTRYEALIAWIWQLKESGIDIIQTANLEQSAAAIVAIYKNCQNPEHKTFKREFKQILQWHPNPVITSLMGIQDAGLGEKRATLLAQKYETFVGTIVADEAEIRELIGKAAAEKYLKAIGRT